MRLIDRERVIKGLECCAVQTDDFPPLCEQCPYRDDKIGSCEYYHDILSDALALLKAEPVKRGRWIMGDTAEAYDIQGVKTWAVKAKCSECGLVCRFIEAHGIYDFCPRCGAKAVCDYDAPTIGEDEDDSDKPDP